MVFTKEQELASQLRIKVDSDFRVFGPRDARHVPNPLVAPLHSGLLGLTNVLTLHLTSFGLEDHERAWFCLQIVALDFFF